MEWILRLSNMYFENGAVPKDWNSAVIASLHKSKGEGILYRNYRGISLLACLEKYMQGYY